MEDLIEATRNLSDFLWRMGGFLGNLAKKLEALKGDYEDLRRDEQIDYKRLPVRARKALTRLSIHTRRDLKGLRREDLDNCKNCGPRTMGEIGSLMVELEIPLPGDWRDLPLRELPERWKQ
jgi:DNA-directed RNA polymerase alpha subunit